MYHQQSHHHALEKENIYDSNTSLLYPSIFRFGYIDVEPEFEEEVLGLNGKELNGSEIRIDKAKPKGAQAQEKPPSNPSMYSFPLNYIIYLRAYADSKGPDQPVHPSSLIWAFTVH